MEHIPILKIGNLLLVSIQVDLHDKLALTLQDDLSEQIVATGARGVLIDISTLEIVDSFIGRMLSTIASLSRILDAETVVVGMRPAVAVTLVELGLSMPSVRTALTVEQGLALLGAEVKVAWENGVAGENGEETGLDDGSAPGRDVVGGAGGPKTTRSSSSRAVGPCPGDADVLPSGGAPAAGREVPG